MRRLAATALVLVGVFVATGPGAAARLTGTGSADELRGTPSADTIRGRGGNDLIVGGGGKDVLLGGTGGDRISSAFDGARDQVQCGPGRDIAVAELFDQVAKDCEVVSRQLSRDRGTNPLAQHETQVEPSAWAVGKTIVTVFQSGRFRDEGAEAIGWSTSPDAGKTWRSGFLPQLSGLPNASFAAASDPVVTYDAAHRWWIATVLVLAGDEIELVASRSRNGLTWSGPILMRRAEGEDFDKEWIACDSWTSSPHRGRCYVAYMDFNAEELRVIRSDDGGATWSQPATGTTALLARGAIVNGAAPVVRPNGSLLVLFSVTAALSIGDDAIALVRSTDGGATFGPVERVAHLPYRDVIGVRNQPFPSVGVDSRGVVTAAWSACAAYQCETNSVWISRTSNGVTWSEPTEVPTGEEPFADNFLPALGVEPTTGRLAITYYSLPQAEGCDVIYTCKRGIDAWLVQSPNAGGTWATPRRLNAETMSPSWLPETSFGRMLGDYVATVWSGGRAVSVEAMASEVSGSPHHEAVMAAALG